MNSQSHFTNPDHIYPNSHTHTSPIDNKPANGKGQAPKPLRLFAGLKTRTHVRAGAIGDPIIVLPRSYSDGPEQSDNCQMVCEG